MRTVFWGTPEAAVPALEALLEAPDADVAAVVTNPDRPGGRGHRLRPPPVKIAAQAAGLDVWQPGRPLEVADRLAAVEADVCAVVAYGALLPARLLALPRAGFVNLHFSLLPAWRGAAPVAHTILAGDDVTGVTCFVLDEGMDTGPVLLEASTRVGEDETAGELTVRLARLGAPLLVDALRGLVAGTLTPRGQEHGRATYAPKIDPADAAVDWTADAGRVHRVVRAYNPLPGAFTSLRGERLKLHRVRPLAAAAGGTPPGAPGEVVALEGGVPLVACGAGGVLLEEVQPAGRARMAGADFANGYRPLGERLGA